MVIPLGIENQEIALIRKISQNYFLKKSFPGFIFVPLVNENKK
jgi:hypothetical protein